MLISPRARALIEALHEPCSNEKRWAIAQQFLDYEHAEALALGKPWSPNGTPEVLSCSDATGEP